MCGAPPPPTFRPPSAAPRGAAIAERMSPVSRGDALFCNLLPFASFSFLLCTFFVAHTLRPSLAHPSTDSPSHTAMRPSTFLHHPLPTLHVLDTRTAAHATSHRTTAGGKSQLKTNEAAKSIKCKVRSLGCSRTPPPDLPANLPLHREPCRPEAALGQQAPQAQVRGLLRHPRAQPVTAAAHARLTNKRVVLYALFECRPPPLRPPPRPPAVAHTPPHLQERLAPLRRVRTAACLPSRLRACPSTRPQVPVPSTRPTRRHRTALLRRPRRCAPRPQGRIRRSPSRAPSRNRR